jgi:DNA adenine methylase
MADTVVKRVGGKVKLAKWIQGWLPPHDTFVEPFGGSFAVGLSLPQRGSDYRLVYNDLDKHVFNFFHVLQQHTAEFLFKLEATSYSREEFERAHDIIHSGEYIHCDEVERARLYLISNRQSFAGKEDRTWCISRQGENIVHTWKNLPRLVQEVAEKLKNAFIENRDYKLLEGSFDGERTLWYLDPPYESVEDDYYHVNKDGGFNHVEMAAWVKELKGSVAISYYDSPTVRKLYEGFDAHTIDVVKHMQRTGKGQEKKTKGTEILFVRASEWAKEKSQDGDVWNALE